MKRNIYLSFLTAIICFFANTLFAQTYYLDRDFNVGSGFNAKTSIIERQADGKLIVAGEFTEFDGTARNKIARLNSDGTLDNTFGAATTFTGEAIYALAIDLTSGDIYVANSSADVVTKLDSDGATDLLYSFDDTDFDGPINALAVDSNGKLVAGQGVGTSGIKARIARFNDDGSLDNTFTAADFNGKFPANNSISSSTKINDIFIDGDGKILVAGNFTSFGGVAEGFIRLNADGSTDESFDLNFLQEVITSEKFAIAQQADGKYLVSGIGVNSNGGTTIERFNADGSLDEEGYNPLSACCGFFKPTNKIQEINNGIVIGGLAYGLLLKNSVDGTDIDIEPGDGHFPDQQFQSLEIQDFVIDDEDGIISVGNIGSYNTTSVGYITRVESCETITIDEDLPFSTAGCATEDKQISIAATGTGLTYQWQIRDSFDFTDEFRDLADDAAYSGTSTATLTVLGATTDLTDNRYRCIISDGSCSVVSSETRLQIETGQTITTQPSDSTACLGESINFSLAVDGSSSDIQWQVDSLDGNGFIDITGANGLAVSTGEVSEDNEGLKYRAILSTCNTPITSDEAVLSIATKPEIISTSPEVSLSVCQSGDGSFTVEAEGEGTLTYQWQYYRGSNLYTDLSDGGVYSGSSTATLTLTGADSSLPEILESNADRDIAYFRCVVSNAAGCQVETRLLSFIIQKNAPQITNNPQDFEICYDPASETPIAGSFLVQGNNMGTFQWQVDIGDGFEDMVEDSIFTGVNSSILRFEGVTDSLNSFLFRCIIGPCGPVTSGTATMIIDRLPDVETIYEGQDFSPYVCEGSDITFKVSSSVANVNYQWQKDGTDINPNDTRYSGVNSAELTVLNIDTDLDDAQYRCVVTTENDLCNDRLSQNRRLRVVEEIEFTNGNFEREVELCENRSGRVLSQLVRNFERNLQTYQWQVAFKNSDVFIDLQEDDTYTNVSGNNLNSNGSNVPLQIDTARISLDSTRYRLVIKGCESDFISDTVLLTINQNPIITNIGENQILCIGEDIEAVFAVSAIGDDLQYRWEYSADSEFTSPSLLRDFSNRDTIDVAISTISTGFVRAVVRNDISCNQLVFSSPILVVVNEVTITREPNFFQLGCVGEEFQLNVEGRGENLTYQWQVSVSDGEYTDLTDDELYSGTNNDTLIFLSLTAEMRDFDYRCVVGGNCESQTSQSISGFVQIVDKPSIITQRNGNVLELVVDVGFNSIEWLDESGAVVSTSYPFIPQDFGTYQARVIVGNCTEISDPFNIADEILSADVLVDLRVYPNPVSDNLTIKSDILPIDKIELIDISGKILKSLDVKGRETSFSMENQKAGVYFINIHAGGKISQQRIIKQ